MLSKDREALRKWLIDNGFSDYLEEFETEGVFLCDLPYLTLDQLQSVLGMKPIPAQRLLREVNKQFRDGERETQIPDSPPLPDECQKTPADQLPTYIAHSWQAFCVSNHPRESIYRLVDTLEAAVRFCTILALSQYRASTQERMPLELATEIQGLIRTPTLGQWLKLLRLLVERQNSLENNSPQVVDLTFASDAFEKYCENLTGDEADKKSLLVMRNALAHGGGFSVKQARTYCRCHSQSIVDILQAIIETLAGARLLGVQNGNVLELKGVRPEKAHIPSFIPERGDEGPWLVRNRSSISLDPLLVFRPIQNSSRAGNNENNCISQIYSRLDKDALLYTPVGIDLIQTEDSSAVKILRDLLRLDELKQYNKKNRRAATNGFPWHDFLDEAHLIAGGVVGRQQAISDIKSWIKSKTDSHDQRRIGWIYGSPGMGKSSVVAKIAADLDGGNLLRLPKEKYDAKKNSGKVIFYHQFRSGDPRNNSDSFLRLLLSMLDSWDSLANGMPTSSRVEVSLYERQELKEIVQGRLRSLLRECKTSVDNQPSGPHAPILLIIIDGLDEVARVEPSVTGLIKDLAMQGGLWLVAGRAEVAFEDAYAAEYVDVLFPDGLPAMRASEMRTMLLEKMGEQRYELLSLDQEALEQTSPYNDFVEEVVQRSGGLPLYIHLLLADLNSRNLTVQDAASLPESLNAYYESLLKRLQIGDLQRALSLIVSTVAISAEPVTADSLAWLLAYDDTRKTVADSDKRLAIAALRAARSLLRSEKTLDGVYGYALYHLSFQDYVLRTGSELSRSIRSSLFRLSALADDLDNISDEQLKNHLRRHCVEYESNFSNWLSPNERYVRLSAAARRLCDSKFFSEMLAAWKGQSEPVALMFHHTFNQMQSKSTDMSLSLATKFYIYLIEGSADKASLSIVSVHALLCYLKPEQFYRAVLELTTCPTMLEINCRHPINHARLLARRANRCRKALEHEKAERFLDRSLSIFGECAHAKKDLPPTELQRIFYDRGYLAYLKADFRKANSLLRESARLARESEDECGEWISRCVSARFKMLACLAEGAKYRNSGEVGLNSIKRHPVRYLCADWNLLKTTVLEFDSVLESALPAFIKLWRDNGNVNAERWVMNVVAHQFETSYLIADGDRAASCMDLLVGNGWVSRIGGQAHLLPHKARLCSLRGEYLDAISIYEDILRDEGGGYRREEIARLLFDAGWSYVCAGNLEEGIVRWNDGLSQSAAGGNAHWFPLLEASVDLIGC